MSELGFGECLPDLTQTLSFVLMTFLAGAI